MSLVQLIWPVHCWCFSISRVCLLQIYGKTGQWEEAVQVLDQLEAQVTSHLRLQWVPFLHQADDQCDCCLTFRNHRTQLSVYKLLPTAKTCLPAAGNCSGGAHVQHHHQCVQPERPGRRRAESLPAHADRRRTADRHHLHRPHLRLRQDRAGMDILSLPPAGSVLEAPKPNFCNNADPNPNPPCTEESLPEARMGYHDGDATTACL